MPPIPSLSFASSASSRGEQTGEQRSATGDVSVGGGLPKWAIYAGVGLGVIAGLVFIYKWATKP